MRDGVLLEATVALPAGDGPFPVVLVRTAYNRGGNTGLDFTRRGIAFVARLTDVYPDGRSVNMTEGVIRARFREQNWQSPELIEPGRVLEYTIQLQPTSNLFKQGHRIRLDITRSNFPLWDRDLNTGNAPGADTDMQIANQAVYHDSRHASHIFLPIVPAD